MNKYLQIDKSSQENIIKKTDFQWFSILKMIIHFYFILKLWTIRPISKVILSHKM